MTLLLALALLARAAEFNDARLAAAVAALKAAAGRSDAKQFSDRIRRSADNARRGGGCAIAGRVTLDGPGDAEAVSAQMLIYPGGWYADYYDPSGRAIGFRAPGYDPVDVHPACPVDGGVAWVDVAMKPTPKDGFGAVIARLVLDGGGDPREAKVTVYPAMPATNLENTGFDARRACMSSKHCPSIKAPAASVDKSGALKAEDLSPIEHGVYVTAPGYVSHYSTFAVLPGEIADAGVVTLERSRKIVLRYLVAEKLPFKGSPRLGSAEGGGLWSAGKPIYNDLSFGQKDGALTVTPAIGPSDIADLGEGRLEDFAVKVGTGSLKPDAPWRWPVVDGHVYLFHMRLFPRWVLVETRVERP